MLDQAILLVEDNPDDAYLTTRVLQRVDISNVVVKQSGEEALDYLSDNSKPMPNLILLDIRLPGIDGIEVLRKLKDGCETKDIPVVVLSSSANHKDIWPCTECHIVKYIRKPLSRADSLFIIDKLKNDAIATKNI